MYTKHIVIIFDECHRSQFGDMHTAIVNVLPFRVDYIKTVDAEEEITDEMVWDINRENRNTDFLC
ncbi:putative uncharacterized protein [Roseburia sp. CAG:303]|nr:putative uncharacterized protein [Roseburia sp. CAG:303]